ncbi:DUF1573 domain-containing protein [Myroides odoratus]|uniref:Protein of uncharacterized function (DUF1573) n=1 Tax=Myroides odoratus TaxID=256 RepID=A0A378U4A4_MYROD|nr:DUF1573 domain-containing protein [Myroides odoratus]MCS4240411.1 hypothetical protein [Myroides odoratus]MDH6601445.1 hypothetical protein [Myroides gitamensis]QQU02672.1 DUF1573 domain-containing protein [Myroides odoratus]STZ70109.1 Protein of uncharacterised function (DUF1573) [Myroides odoratus]
MKKVFMLSCVALLTMTACKKNDASSRISEDNVAKVEQDAVTKQNQGSPKMEFAELLHDFGTIGNNEAVETEFEFTNTGNADLVIIDARATCGCTVPEYQKTPIKPGEKSKLKVRFQTGAVGQQQKTVTLTTNTEKGEELLTIKANVSPAN